MGTIVCLVIIPAVRVSFLASLICDNLADVWLLLRYQIMQFFLIHKCISLPLCLLKLSIRELKIDFKSFFKKIMQEKSAPSGAYTQKEMTLDLLLTQDQGSSIVDGINHLRNLLLSIDLFSGSLLNTHLIHKICSNLKVM